MSLLDKIPFFETISYNKGTKLYSGHSKRLAEIKGLGTSDKFTVYSLDIDPEDDQVYLFEVKRYYGSGECETTEKMEINEWELEEFQEFFKSLGKK